MSSDAFCRRGAWSTTSGRPRPAGCARSPSTRANHDIQAAKTLWAHHRGIEAQRRGCEPGALVAGTKKDLVQTPRLARRPGHVAIYGWHRPDGRAIQPLYCGHVDHYLDYSHGLRLVWGRIRVDGHEVAIGTALASPNLAPLLSDEGTIPAR